MPVTGHDSLNTRRQLNVGGKSYDFFSRQIRFDFSAKDRTTFSADLVRLFSKNSYDFSIRLFSNKSYDFLSRFGSAFHQKVV